MKKTYLEPNMEVVKIEPHQLLNGSPNAGIDPTKDIFITYPPTLSDPSFEAYQKGGIRVVSVSTGSITFKATGDVPTRDLDIILIVR